MSKKNKYEDKFVITASFKNISATSDNYIEAYTDDFKEALNFAKGILNEAGITLTYKTVSGKGMSESRRSIDDFILDVIDYLTVKGIGSEDEETRKYFEELDVYKDFISV